METTEKRYGCEFTSNKEELLIYSIENTEKKVPLGISFVETSGKKYGCEFI